MKKIITVAVCIVLSLSALTACGKTKKTDVTDLNKSFSCNAKITYNETEANAAITRHSEGVWDIGFNSPTALDGFSLFYDNDNVKVDYKGLSFDMKTESLPMQAMAALVMKTIDNAASQKEIEYTNKGDNLVYNGKLDDAKYTITLNSKTGAIIGLEMPSLNLDVKFSDFKVNKENSENAGENNANGENANNANANLNSSNADNNQSSSVSESTEINENTENKENANNDDTNTENNKDNNAE